MQNEPALIHTPIADVSVGQMIQLTVLGDAHEVVTHEVLEDGIVFVTTAAGRDFFPASSSCWVAACQLCEAAGDWSPSTPVDGYCEPCLDMVRDQAAEWAVR